MSSLRFNQTNLFRRQFEVFSNSLHQLLSDDHSLRTSKPSEGSIRRKISTTHSAHCTIAGDVIDTVSMSHFSSHHLYKYVGVLKWNVK